MFKRIRITILLYILLFVALGELLSQWRSTDWNNSLRVAVYPVNGSGSEEVGQFIAALDASAFTDIERFFEQQAASWGISLERPFRIRLADRLDYAPPAAPAGGGPLGTVIWSLRMRWLVTRLNWSEDGPAPDITVFAIYHDGATGASLDRSTALRKGLIAMANLFAERSARGSNQMVIAHELLHTLGATDKYDPATTWPVYPTGLADPHRSPLYPQDKAELMAGRIATGVASAVQPSSLRQVVIGPVTALEIGWIRELP